jgi:hypothetical protein
MAWQQFSVLRKSCRFPDRCPVCLCVGPDRALFIESVSGHFSGFYLVAKSYRHLRVAVPFCKSCTRRIIRRSRWGTACLFASFFACAGLALWLDLSGLSAGVLTVLICGPIMWWFQSRGSMLRIDDYDDERMTISIKHSAYADLFRNLNMETLEK